MNEAIEVLADQVEEENVVSFFIGFPPCVRLESLITEIAPPSHEGISRKYLFCWGVQKIQRRNSIEIYFLILLPERDGCCERGERKQSHEGSRCSLASESMINAFLVAHAMIAMTTKHETRFN